MSEPWVFYVPGPKPGPGVNPPWVRHSVRPATMLEHEIEQRAHELRVEHGAAKAVGGENDVELVLLRNYSAKKARP